MLKLYVNPCVYSVVCETSMTSRRRWHRSSKWRGDVVTGGVRRTWKQSKPTAWARRSDYNRTVTRLDALTQHHNKPTLCYFLAQPSRQTIYSLELVTAELFHVIYLSHRRWETAILTAPHSTKSYTDWNTYISSFHERLDKLFMTMYV